MPIEYERLIDEFHQTTTNQGKIRFLCEKVILYQDTIDIVGWLPLLIESVPYLPVYLQEDEHFLQMIYRYADIILHCDDMVIEQIIVHFQSIYHQLIHDIFPKIKMNHQIKENIIKMIQTKQIGYSDDPFIQQHFGPSFFISLFDQYSMILISFLLTVTYS